MAISAIANRMLETYPRDFNVDKDVLVQCIEACFECAQACTQCADDCLSEDGELQELAKCIRLNLDCADVCAATGRVISRQTEYAVNVSTAVLRACIAACTACGDECAHHGDHMAHCKVCAESCRACAQACERLIAAFG